MPALTIRLLMLLALLMPPSPCRAAEPFAPGEKLTFDLLWTRITVAEVIMSVEPPAEGQAMTRLLMTVRTRPFFDTFFKVRNRIESLVTPDAARSLLYVKDQSEGGFRRHYQTRYDYAAGKARYESLLTGNAKEQDIPAGTHDPLSIFYAYRRFGPFEPGGVFKSPVTDGRDPWATAEATVLRREKVTVPAGTFEALVIRPDLKNISGVFKKKEGSGMLVWITDDARRLPVRMESEVSLGSIVAELTAYESGDDTP